MSLKAMQVSVAVLKAPEQLVYEEEEIRLDNLNPNEVAARTLLSVVSPGTEMAAFAGAPPLRPGITYPRLVGYCNAAKVIAVGSDVKQYQPGDMVLSFQSHRSGFRCHEKQLITHLPEGADLSRVAAAYLYHLSYNALLKSEFRAGHNIAVIGLGTLGLTAVSMASAGGGQVYAVSGHASGRKKALLSGARAVYAREEESLTDTLDEMTGGTGIDIVVTTSNSWDDWLLALQLVRREGTIAVIGFPGRGELPPNFNPLASEYFYYKQMRLIACGFSPDVDLPAHDVRFSQTRNMKYLIDMIAEERLNVDLIVTEKVSWRDLEKVYQRMLTRDPGLVTCALDWGGGYE